MRPQPDEDPVAKAKREMTDEFVSMFSAEADYDGMIAEVVSRFGPPEGVDPRDPRVAAIVAKCVEKHGKAG